MCALALGYVLWRVEWYDRAVYVDAASGQRESVRIAEWDASAGQAVIVTAAGERRSVGLASLETDPRSPGEPLIRPGLRGVVARGEWGWMLAGVAVFFPVPVLLGIRLRTLLSVQRVSLSVGEAARLTYAGNFVNFFLPGTTGGDVYKAYAVARDVRSRHEAVTTVLFDRVIGLAGLILLAGLCSLLAWDDPVVAGWSRALGIVVGVGVVCAVAGFSRRVRRWLWLPWVVERIPFGAHIRRMDRALLLFRRHPGRLVAAFGWTAVAQILSVVSILLAGEALHVRAESVWTTALAYLVYIPLGWVVAAVPISIQGLGVMEEAYIRFFVESSGLAASTAQAFALAMAGRAIQLFWALPGAFVLWRPVHGAEEAAPGGEAAREAASGVSRCR